MPPHTPEEVESEGLYNGYAICVARKAGPCADPFNVGCKHQIAVGEKYVRGDRTGDGHWAVCERVCLECGQRR